MATTTTTEAAPNHDDGGPDSTYLIPPEQLTRSDCEDALRDLREIADRGRRSPAIAAIEDIEAGRSTYFDSSESMLEALRAE